MNQIEKTLQKEWKNRILILTMYGFEVRVKFFRTNCEIIVSFFSCKFADQKIIHSEGFSHVLMINQSRSLLENCSTIEVNKNNRYPSILTRYTTKLFSIEE